MKMQTMVYLFGVAIFLALIVDLFSLLVVRIFVALLVLFVSILWLTGRVIKSLELWLVRKIIIDMSQYPTPRDYMYIFAEGKSYLKLPISQLTIIDRPHPTTTPNNQELLYRNRLSEAELNAVEELFRDCLAEEILIRLKQLAGGNTRAFSSINKHDLWSLAIINLAVLLGVFVSTLYLVFVLRSFYH